MSCNDKDVLEAFAMVAPMSKVTARSVLKRTVKEPGCSNCPAKSFAPALQVAWVLPTRCRNPVCGA